MVENRPAQLASQVKTQLLQEMRSGKYKNSFRLPTEVDLADEMNVSRTAIRDALSALEQEGYISRRRGTGTIINRHVVNVAVRFDGEEEFMKIVEKSGYEPALGYLDMGMMTADEEVAGRLQVDVGTAVFSVTRVITADGIPVIYCVDYIPAAAIRDESYTAEDLKSPIFEFLSKYCGLEGAMDLTDLHAANAKGDVAERLSIPEGAAVLRFDEVWYEFGGTPILYAREFYREGMVTHTILRNRHEKY